MISRAQLFILFALLVLASAVAMACSSGDDKATSPAATSPVATSRAATSPAATAGASPAAAAGATVSVSKDAKLGNILVNAAGMTLYKFDNDKPGVSNCTGACAPNWPPLTATGSPKAGSGVTGALAAMTRTDGKQQVTYNGSPLYMYIKDTKAGDTLGNGVGGIWHVVAP